MRDSLVRGFSLSSISLAAVLVFIISSCSLLPESLQETLMPNAEEVSVEPEPESHNVQQDSAEESEIEPQKKAFSSSYIGSEQGLEESLAEVDEPSSEAANPAPEAADIAQIDPIYIDALDAGTQIDIDNLCQEIGNKLGSVSKEDCLSHGFTSNGGRSVLGRPLAIKDFPELAGKEPLGRVMLIGGIHGDEFSAVSIVFKWMQILEKHHSGIFSWRFIPVVNPDGLLAEKSTRQNYNGVDLNRNFPSNDWRALALQYWREQTNSNSRRFPGPDAGSEPEVNWLVSEIEAYQPDVIISVHAPYHLVDYDGPPEAPKRLGELHLRKLGVYPGSLGNYVGVDMGMPVVTIELPYAGILPDPGEISKMWTDLVAWLIGERSKVAEAN